LEANSSLKKTLAAIDKVQNLIDVGNKLRAKLLDASGGEDISPLEQEIKRIQHELDEIINYCTTKKRNWTKMQNMLIKVSLTLSGQPFFPRRLTWRRKGHRLS